MDTLAQVAEVHDLYYSTRASCKVQAIPVEYNTRYSVDFNNMGAGVSVALIPPGNGLRHTMIVLGYQPSSVAAQDGTNALPRGWGYAALNQVSFRVAGSSQFFLTGLQLLARNLDMCRTQNQRDAILSLGGAECKVATDFTTSNPKGIYAYIPLSALVRCSDDGISQPIAGDLLSTQTQFTVQLNPPASFWASATSPPTVALPQQFDVGYFQQEQLIMENRSMSLSMNPDVNLDTNSYSQPIVFDQFEYQVQLSASASSQPVVLSGFRAGRVTELQCYLTDNADTTNDTLFYTPFEIEALYAGTIFASYKNGSSTIWNLVDGTAPSAVNHSKLSYGPAPGGGGNQWNSTPVLSQWCILPFAQPSGSDYEASVNVAGKKIENGIINLQVTTPDPTKTYTLHVIYRYGSSALNFSRASADILFN